MYSEWKKRLVDELGKPESGNIKFEKVPALIKRCPKCHSLSLEYDPKTGRIYCTKCGFEEFLPQIK